MVLAEPEPKASINRWKKTCIPIEERGVGKLGLFLFYIVAMAWKLSLFRNKDVLDRLKSVFLLFASTKVAMHLIQKRRSDGDFFFHEVWHWSNTPVVV